MKCRKKFYKTRQNLYKPDIKSQQKTCKRHEKPIKNKYVLKSQCIFKNGLPRLKCIFN